MFEFFENFDFLSHGFDVFFLFSFFLYGLNGHELPCEFFSGLVHLAVCPLSDQGDDLIVLLFVLDGHSLKSLINLFFVFVIRIQKQAKR